MISRRTAFLLLPVLAAGSAGAQPASTARSAPILHEYVPTPSEGRRSRWARDGRLPDQLRMGDRMLPRPAASRRPSRAERVLGRHKMDRATTVAPDRTTTHDGVLKYTAEFNPSVVPFKRMSAFDAVDEGFRLRVKDPRPRTVPLARRATPPDRTAFWGSLVLHVRKGKTTPIPSVAADPVIVSYQATPATVVQFYRDSADNFSVGADTNAQIRLVFVTDARRTYFSPELPALVRTAQVPPALRPQLPPAVQRAADRVLAHVGVDRRQTLRRQLERLIAYFRNFTAGQLPRDSGTTYLDIALSQKGVCRHRSWAFVITAQAAGIPARYVQNEAHAFTEVFVPRLGWIRVDLGGASSELRVANARDKAVHNPGPDPFPRPSRFARNYSQLNGPRVSGIRPSQRVRQVASRRRTGRDLGRFRGQRPATTGAATGSGATGGGGAGPPVRVAGGPDDGAGPPTAVQVSTRLSLRCGKNTAQRGGMVHVWGRANTEDGPAGQLRVEIYLSKSGTIAEALLGATVTDDKGRFDVKLPVPKFLLVGDYRVYAATPGNARFLPSISR